MELVIVLDPPDGGLAGRAGEVAQVAELVRAAGRGGGGALLVRGEAGAGKTTLLRSAPAESTLRLYAAGSADESGVPGAALHQLLHPLGAAGLLSADLGPLELATAVLECLAAGGAEPGAVGARRAVVCLLDDVELFDPRSRDVLAMVARRLAGTAVAVVFATRQEADEPDLIAGVPVLRLGPLDPAASRELLAGRLGPAAPAVVLAALAELGQGNPLALTELAGSLTPDQVGGRAPLPEWLPPSSRLLRHHRALLGALSAAARATCLLAAAEELPPAVLLRALAAGELPAAALDDAQQRGLLVDTAGALRYRDPLLRASAYHDTPYQQRRWAHRLLRDLSTDPLGRAAHQVAAGDAPDDEQAERLVRTAIAARKQGDYQLAVRALELAAALAADPATGRRHLLAAAWHAWLGGDADRARLLLARARPEDSSTAPSAYAELLHGELELSTGTVDAAYIRLDSAAGQRSEEDRAGAVRALLRAAETAMLTGDQVRAARAYQAAVQLRGGPEGPWHRLAFAQLAGITAALEGDHARANTALSEVIELSGRIGDSISLERGSVAALFLGDEALAVRMAARSVATARVRSAHGVLSRSLAQLAFAEHCAGLFPAAREHAGEGLRLAQLAGQDNLAAIHLSTLALLAAAAGDPDDLIPVAAEAAARAADRGLSRPDAIVTWAVGRRALGDSRAEDAMATLRPLMSGSLGRAHRSVQVLAISDLVEAAVQVGRPLPGGRAALQALTRWAAATNSRPLRALVLRCQAQLAPDAGAEQLLDQALTLHAGAGSEYERARTQLYYGLFLRRRRRPVDARPRLHDAVATFDRIGATPWSDRARAELRAAGGTPATAPGTPAPAPTPASRAAELTPRQLEIARLAAGGATNREIASQLFLSQRTVDFHLRRVFAQLGIRSRLELTRLV
jgi:DNA-binding CsgD family transcriptional regulator